MPPSTTWEPVGPPSLRERPLGSLPVYLSDGVIGLRVGVIGLRVGVVPHLRCIAMLNGFAGVDPDSG